MGEVVDLYAPRSEVITRIMAEWLPEHGRVDLPIAKLAVPVEVWRAAARAAGPIIRRPIRTRIGIYGEISAWIADWPIDDRERELQLANDRRRMEAMERHLLALRDEDGE